MLPEPPIGLLGASLIDRTGKGRSEEAFRGLVLRHAPAIGPAPAVLLIDKIRDEYIALHHQPGQNGVKALAPVPAVACLPLEAGGGHRLQGQKPLIELLVLIGGQAVVKAGVEIVAVPAEIGKVPKPLF